MEIVIFENKSWEEIPQQDNPAFDYIDGDENKGRYQECMLVCMHKPKLKLYNVVHIPMSGSVEILESLLSFNNAKIIAENY